MKIEKINDKQIRCTLTGEDLASRKIKLSELAYGSEKARALFQDMMEIAEENFGFEADNMPLVIEAIPINTDSVVLIITKVEDPDELDTRFARFSPEGGEPEYENTFAELKDRLEGADDVLGLIKKIIEAKKRALQSQNAANAANAPEAVSSSASADTANPTVEQIVDDSSISENDEEIRNLTRFYLFRSLDDAIHVGGILGSIYHGPNTLYKNPDTGEYYLILKKAESTAEEFNKVCNVLSEYALSCRFLPGMDAHFAEHMEVLIPENALQNLYLLH